MTLNFERPSLQEQVMKDDEGLRRYSEFLLARDGEADLLRQRLSKREEFFDDIARNPIRSRALIDPATYFRNMAHGRRETGLEPRMLWLLATAKANQVERFGVGLAELLGRVSTDDPTRVHVLLQETYHTRILAYIVAMFGLPVRPRPPRLLVRLMIHLMVSIPEACALPLVGAGEMVGCVIFRELRDKGVKLFADEPAVAERIRILYDEILVDEIGHVGFIAARLDERGRAIMRWLYARLSSTLASQFPEIGMLLGHQELEGRLRAFHFADVAAGLPNVFTAALI
jgi:hypothetical protein